MHRLGEEETLHSGQRHSPSLWMLCLVYIVVIDKGLVLVRRTAPC